MDRLRRHDHVRCAYPSRCRCGSRGDCDKGRAALCDAGVPAKVLGYRFDEELRGKLLEIDFSQIDEAFVKEHRDLFVESQKDFVKYLEELPKKMGDKENETTR